MIKSGGDESADGKELPENDKASLKLDEACRPTGWVRVEKDIDLTDPKVSSGWTILRVILRELSTRHVLVDYTSKERSVT